jgi:phosphoserine aminotransferase
MTKRVINFSAGPSAIPLAVLEKAKEELLDYNGTGMSVMEMSHRSKEFTEIIEKTEAGLRENMAIPDDYEIIFIQGGASLQFAMVPMNLYEKGKPVNIIHTGLWTKKAIGELKNLTEYRIAASTEADGYRRLPSESEINIDKNASYLHIVSNNTVVGTQWKNFPKSGDVPLVADMSSDILSREIDVSKFGLIFAGAQKNIGPAGAAVVIIRRDLAERASEKLPIMMQYRTYIENKSLYNTPPTFTIYIMKLVMDWIKSQGGVKAIEKMNIQKADLLYNAIDESPFYQSPIAPEFRSLMNVVMRINRSEELESKFVKEADRAGLSGLKGHRLAGGIRASIYNALDINAVKKLIEFMKEFEKKNG